MTRKLGEEPGTEIYRLNVDLDAQTHHNLRTTIPRRGLKSDVVRCLLEMYNEAFAKDPNILMDVLAVPRRAFIDTKRSKITNPIGHNISDIMENDK